MRSPVLSLCLYAILAGASVARSAPTEFPYEAIVETDGVVVRSGPGERYDPTLKLSTGQKVTVQRHDPGGWYMILPPPGSFSWIDATYVEKTGPETGTVRVPATGDGLPPRVVVWIGSEFTDEHKYFGRQLANLDEVRILGEKTQTTERGPTTFYKIAPPRLEYRWIKGDFVVPLSDASRIARSTPEGTPPVATPTISADSDRLNPFAGPLSVGGAMSAPGFPPEQGPSLLERDLNREFGLPASRPGDAGQAGMTTARTQLQELDERLRTMLAQTPDHWDLAGMEQSYRELQAHSPPSMAGQIESRLTAINSRKRVKAEFDSFVALTRQTEERDAALLSMQQDLSQGTVPVQLGQPSGFPQQLTNGPPPTGDPTQAVTVIPPTSIPIQPGAGSLGMQPSRGGLPGVAPSAAVPQMDGAGLIRRLPRPQPGLPTHALTTPDGRHLAYLSAGRGVRLDDYVGRSMGVVGQRTHDPRVRSDVIVVERLTPVQLQP